MKNRLFNTICDLKNLYRAWKRVRQKGAGGGIDGITLQDFEKQLQHNLDQIQNALIKESYVPFPAKRIYIPKSKPGEKRALALPVIRDKIIQEAVRNVIEPVFNSMFLDVSFAYRTSRGPYKAVEKISDYIHQRNHCIATADIDNFFDSINHDILLNRFSQKISEAPIIRLIELWLKNGIVSRGKWVDVEQGISQGNVISPLLSNIYLHSLDLEMQKTDACYLRYADDFIILGKSRDIVRNALNQARRHLHNYLDLNLNSNSIEIRDYKQGFTFLGFEFTGTQKKVASEKIEKMKEKIKSVLHKQANPEIAIEMLNHSISGWLNYYGKTATEELLDFLDKFLFREIKLWLSKLVKKSQKTKKYYSGLIFKIRWFSEKSYIQIQKITRELISAASIRKSDSYKKQGKESVDKLILRQKRRYRKVLSKDRDIILANPGVFIGKTQKRAVVKQKRKILREIPFFQLKNILVASPGVSFSSDLIKYCADYDIPVSFIGPNGKVYAHLITPTFPLYYRTNLQLAAFQNGKALSIASSIIICKLKNQMNLLKYYGKYKNRSKLFQESVTESIKNIAAQIDKISCSNFNEDYEKARNQLFALEGQGAAHYWRMVKYLIGSDVFFEKRERRGATDIFNSLLNYGYGIMYSYLFQRIIVARLNPNISYLHKSQGNKPTLVFDLIELFRQPVVDKTIISMIRRRTKFVMDGIWLSQDTKNLVLENIMKRLDQSQYYHGKHFSMRQIIDLEIQLLNNFLEKESKYKPFVQKW